MYILDLLSVRLKSKKGGEGREIKEQKKGGGK